MSMLLSGHAKWGRRRRDRTCAQNDAFAGDTNTCNRSSWFKKVDDQDAIWVKTKLQSIYRYVRAIRLYLKT